MKDTDMKYITIDNILLENAQNKIDYNFAYEFIGRKLESSYADNYEKLEREYFESNSFLEKAITFSYKLEKDEEGYIKSLEVHKYKDKYFGHGRPIIDELAVTKKDESAIRECINNSIAFTLDDECNTLVNELEKADNLPYGYKFSKRSAKNVVLYDKKKNVIEISKDLIKKCLAISHMFLDILYDEQLYKDNGELFKKEEIKPLLSILSCCNYSEYHDLIKLQKDVERRRILRESEKGYKELIKAVKANDTESVEKYAKYSIIYENDYAKNKNHPFILAIEEHPEYVKALIKAGSYVNPCCKAKEKGKAYSSALDIAYSNKDYKVLQLIADCYDPEKIEKDNEKPKWGETRTYKAAIGRFTLNVNSLICKDLDYKAAKILIPHTAGMVIDDYKINKDIDVNQIEFLSQFENIRINWTKEHFEKIHPTNKEVCLKMVEQGCRPDAINYFIDVDAFDLYKIGMGKWIKPQDLFFKQESYIKIFDRKQEWHRIAKDTTWRYWELDNSCLSALFENDKEKFEKVRIKYGLDASYATSVQAYLNSLLKQKEITLFKEFVDKHNININSGTLRDLYLYLGKYNSQERKEILNYIFDRHDECEYSFNGDSYKTNISEKSLRDQYLKAVYKYGEHALVDMCIDKYLVGSTKSVNDFTNHFKENYYQALSECNEWACNQLIKKTMNQLAAGENDKTLFEGPYSDKLSLPMGEIYRTLRNLWTMSGFEWPVDEEKKSKRLEIVRKDISYYLLHVDIGILFLEGALYEWSSDTSTMMRDLEHLRVNDETIINKVVADFDRKNNKQ